MPLALTQTLSRIHRSAVESKWLPTLVGVLGLYLFVLSMSGIKEAWQLAFASESGGALKTIVDLSLSSPIRGLSAGVLITSMIQSSSATVALIVTSVGSGVLSVEQSVFLVMGANIGTTVTNSIVALAHARRTEEFQRVVPAVLVDDFFKIFNIAIFFVLEISTGFLHRASVFIVDSMQALASADQALRLFPDVLDLATEPVVKTVVGGSQSIGLGTGAVAGFLFIFFFLVLISSLKLIADSMSRLFVDRSRQMVDRLFSKPGRSSFIGFATCWLLQSSSVAISLILPFVSQRMIRLKAVYQYSLGASLGTTCDAGQLLSYLKFGPVGLMTGGVHILLNAIGVTLFLLIPGLRDLPVWASRRVGEVICQSKGATLALIFYSAATFFALPVLILGSAYWMS
jgi:sodium-dependent phosphate cotransporter